MSGQRQARVSVLTSRGEEDVSIRIYPASAVPGTSACLVLAHGAGAGQDSHFIVATASALAMRGIETWTFSFPYAEHHRKVPDPSTTLEVCWQAVLEHLAGTTPHRFVVIGGKSMGGRIASQVAARPGLHESVRGLVFLGYPLHPPGQRDRLRVAHWPAVRLPALFVQGSRDAFGTPDELREHLPSWGAATELVVVDGADHSLKARRGGGEWVDDRERATLDTVAAWITGVSG
jgi:predicted alpha/beta-hydrolase family hydrolase